MRKMKMVGSLLFHRAKVCTNAIQCPLPDSIISAAKTMNNMRKIAIEDGQKCLRESPVIVLGSGASIPAGLPSMKKLADHLKGSTPDGILPNTDQNLWDKFINKLVIEGKDLESALQEIQLNRKLSDHVIEQTWNLVSKADTCAFEKVLGNVTHLPLVRLYRHLFDSTGETVSVVTTNYDRLAEYAADHAGFCHYTGFSYGYLRKRQQPRSRLYFKRERDNKAARTVNIWKVHGCLDWFIDQDDQVIAITSARTILDGWQPAIVTPGINKYESAFREPFRSIITGADEALASANAYLCIGFSFNDKHIQPKLLDRWKQGKAFLVILTRTLKENVKEMLKKENNQEFVALEQLEQSGNGTRMWSNKYPEGVSIEGVSLWNLSTFLKHTIEGGA